MEIHKKKVLLIVPNVALVHQMFSDFEEYGWYNVADKCHMIYSGQKKYFEAPCTVSTYQSMYSTKVAKEILQVFDCLLIDENFMGKCKSIKEISTLCINASWRLGCSGTYPPYRTADWFTITGSTGPIVNYSTYKGLQDQGHIAK